MLERPVKLLSSRFSPEVASFSSLRQKERSCLRDVAGEKPFQTRLAARTTNGEAAALDRFGGGSLETAGV